MKRNILPSLASLADLPDPDLLAAVERSLSAEREATACLVAHLGEIDARRLYAAEAFGSMFEFCVEALHMAEGAAYNRIVVARAARRWPALLDALGSGAVHLAGLRVLVPHLSDENHESILAEHSVATAAHGGGVRWYEFRLNKQRSYSQGRGP